MSGVYRLPLRWASSCPFYRIGSQASEKLSCLKSALLESFSQDWTQVSFPCAILLPHLRSSSKLHVKTSRLSYTFMWLQMQNETLLHLGRWCIPPFLTSHPFGNKQELVNKCAELGWDVLNSNLRDRISRPAQTTDFHSGRDSVECSSWEHQLCVRQTRFEFWLLCLLKLLSFSRT